MFKVLESNWNENTAFNAIDGGHFAFLQWALKRDHPLLSPMRCITFAAENGYLSILKWLIDEKGCMMPTDTQPIMEIVVKRGYLRVFAYLHTKGYQWNQRIGEWQPLRVTLTFWSTWFTTD
eukprot:TRINITY_DN11508_c0_g1_i1.p2 TRINITY_DN11508_c0_g1~~TRINITY_DN11508_c0_g1_i1.p2  ORF type:complete len:121 (-),score=0.78 TRINITY_DN11508_c0_g1_i1:139-501(-)